MEHAELKQRCEAGVAIIARRYIPDAVERKVLADAAPKAMPFSLMINWEALVADVVLKILRNVGDLLIELGRERRADIERAATDTVIAFVTWDIPGLPETLERKIDAAVQKNATRAIQSLLDSVFGEV